MPVPAPKPAQAPVLAAPVRQTASLPAAGAAARPVLPVPPGLYVVVIDPGHGGNDPGAVSESGTREKEVVFKMAKALKSALETSGRYTVHLTRTDDRFIELSRRVQMARDLDADLFISLHADILDGVKVQGASIYTLSEKASDREAARLARKENAVDLLPGVDIESESQDVISILVDLTQRDTKNNSVRFARALLPEFEARSIDLVNNTHRFGPFRVLTAPDVPSVLIELGFLSSKGDEKNLLDEGWRTRMADAIRAGVDTYFSSRTAFAVPLE
ncbi:MAG: N-acetylmuramoyl-L-alanine amidase [Alphaproteobacteria bacterium]|nr:N-acetylmuramoyl-L-alanine amidase [Alphaproteobacteria bacterium]